MHLFITSCPWGWPHFEQGSEQLIPSDLKYSMSEILLLWYIIHCSFGNKLIIAYPS